MLSLAIRTDNPQAEIYLYSEDQELGSVIWQAHRELSDTIDEKIDELLGQNSKNRQDLQRVIVYEGPGSFTGLRIGFSVANAIGYGQGIPVSACGGESWISLGLGSKEKKYKPVHPVYGKDPHITKPRK